MPDQERSGRAAEKRRELAEMSDASIFWDMSDPLLRSGDETAKSSRALQDYALMGPGRSLRRLCADYQDQKNPPTKRSATIDGWSSKFDWVDRVAVFDLSEFERDLEGYHDDREKWRRRRDVLLDLFFARIASVMTVWQSSTMVDKQGQLKAGVSELTQALRLLLNESRTEHEDLPEFAGRPGDPLSAAVNALISREMARLVNPGPSRFIDGVAQNTDGGGVGGLPGPDNGDGDG